MLKRQILTRYEEQAFGKARRVSRRQFLGRIATVPIVAGSVGGRWLPAAGSNLATQAIATGSVGFSSTSVIVNEKPRFLVAGTIDYFRCPPQHWRDRLLKAKRAGLNTAMVYVPWNVHEPAEGNFQFTGISDIAAYLKICADMDLMVIVRVGPFICNEWEAAGYPAWLIGKEGSEFRVRSSITETYIQRWFEQLCQQIVPLQASRGGPVILVQVENEYYFDPMPGAVDYMQYLVRTLRRCGIDLPMSECGSGDEIHTPGLLETINGYGMGGNTKFRKEHPELPLLVSEHYTHWSDCWGWTSEDNPKRVALEQVSIEALARQVMLSYFCFHGGTSFGYFGSSTWKTDHSWTTPRYYALSPVMEGGGFSDRYFAVKSASIPVLNFEDFFCKAKEITAPLTFVGPVRTLALGAEQGSMIFVLPFYPVTSTLQYRAAGDDTVVSLLESRPSPEVEAEAGTVELPTGKRVSLAAGSVRALILPHEFRVDSKNKVDYANATLLGIGGNASRRVVIFWGDPGRTGVVSVNGEEKEFVFPAEEPIAVHAGSVTILALSPEMCDRTWFADGRVMVGPAYVGEFANKKHECWINESTRLVLTVEPDGTIGFFKVTANPVSAEVISLIWSGCSLFEPTDKGSEGWQSLDKPLSLERLGTKAYYGYQWYRATVYSKEGGDSGLLFTAAADRFHVWADGKYLGVFGRATGDTRDMFPLYLSTGKTVLTFLCDNMGRSSEGRAHQYKGIWGSVYAGASRQTLDEVSLMTARGPLRDGWEFRNFRFFNPGGKFYEAVLKVPGQLGRGLFLTLRKLTHYAWVTVNGTLLGEHHGDYSVLDGFGASEYVLQPPTPVGETEIRLRLYGSSAPDLSTSLTVYSYPLDGELKDWAFRPWQNPHPESAVGIRSGEPCWWQAKLDKPPMSEPLFISTQGLSKGQVFLNGEAMGRYWSIGPQYTVYLPGLAARATLAVFDEQGMSPDKTLVFRDERVPVTKVIL